MGEKMMAGRRMEQDEKMMKKKTALVQYSYLDKYSFCQQFVTTSDTFTSRRAILILILK